MRDFINNELEVGDTVVFSHEGKLIRGVIFDFASEMTARVILVDEMQVFRHLYTIERSTMLVDSCNILKH